MISEVEFYNSVQNDTLYELTKEDFNYYYKKVLKQIEKPLKYINEAEYEVIPNSKITTNDPPCFDNYNNTNLYRFAYWTWALFNQNRPGMDFTLTSYMDAPVYVLNGYNREQLTRERNMETAVDKWCKEGILKYCKEPIEIIYKKTPESESVKELNKQLMQLAIKHHFAVEY